MIKYSNPFLHSLGNIRTQPQQNQFTQPQNQYDFSGWGDRVAKIEEGIAGLTNQFNSFQKPGDVAPEYTGNAAPEPLEQPSVNPLGFENGQLRPPIPGNQLDSKPISPFSQHLMDGEWRQLTPEEFGTKFPNSPFNQNGIPQNTGYVPEPYTGGDRGLAMQAGMNLPGAGGRPSDLQQPIQQGVGLAGLYQQNNRGAGI